MDETFRRGLKTDASSEWDTFEGEFPEWNVELKSVSRL